VTALRREKNLLCVFLMEFERELRTVIWWGINMITSFLQFGHLILGDVAYTVNLSTFLRGKMTDLVRGCLTILPLEDVQICFSMVISFVFEGGWF